MDAAFGRLMNEIDEQRLDDKTPGLLHQRQRARMTRFHPYGSTGPLRAKKGHVYEGGIRVPGILRWPGHAPPGQVSHEPICGVDLLPTLSSVTGIPVPGDRTIDGASLSAAVRRATRSPEPKPLYWQYNRAGSEVKVALRDGDWKILAGFDPPCPRAGADITDEQMKVLKTARLTGFELYNLRDDVGEATDLVNTAPERFATHEGEAGFLLSGGAGREPRLARLEIAALRGGRIEWPEYKPCEDQPK